MKNQIKIKKAEEIIKLAWNFIIDAKGSWDTYEGDRCLKLIENYRKMERQHYHVAGTTIGQDRDKCAVCDLDLRDTIHIRE